MDRLADMLPPVRLIIHSPDHMAQLARQIAPHLQAGDCLLLEGPIGAGKSHFARSAILALLDMPEDIPSPTFTLVQTYQSNTAEIWHADLYRLTDPQEVVELGLDEAFDTAISFVEWPDRLGGLAPENALKMIFDQGETEDQRILTLYNLPARLRTELVSQDG